MFWPLLPRQNHLLSLPADDQQLADWWEANFAQHVKNHGLDCAWGSYDSERRNVDERQLEILNGVDYSSDLHFNAFLRLREIMPVDDGPPETRVNYFSEPAGGQEENGADPSASAPPDS